MKKKGFSLVEILVSIAIITILSTVGVQSFYSSRQRARLEEDVAKVVQALRTAQNSALAPSRSETGVSDNQELCSIIFKINEDKKLNLYYSSKTSNSNSNCSPSINPYLNLGEISYSSISNNSNSTTEITFNIPFADATTGSIQLNSNNLSKTITVTSAGLINVQ